MNKKGIEFGLILIVIGIISFLIQFGILSGSALMVFINHIELTISLIIIVVGINLIFKKYPFVKVLTWLAFFVAMIVYGNFAGVTEEKSSNEPKKSIVIEQDDKTKSGQLSLDAAALNLTFGSTNTNLVNCISENVGMEYDVDYKNGKEAAVVDFNTNSKDAVKNFFKNLFSKGEISIDRKCNLNINSGVIWDLNMKLDAIDSDVDLSDLKVKTVDIKGNAGNFKLTLGQKYAGTKVNIGANAAKVEVFVPQDSGVRVKIKGNANSKDFRDISLEKQGEYYISKNYNESENKIELNVGVEAGSLEIIGTTSGQLIY